MSKITKAILIETISQDVGLPKTKTAEVVDAVLSRIQSYTDDGQKVALASFGQFEARTRKARQGRNPSTGETIQIPESRTMVFRASKAVKKS